LVEIGADRGFDRIDEAAQDAVLVEALHPAQRGFDRAGNLGLARLAFVGGNVEARIEARAEQTHEIGGDRRMLDQGRPHIALGIGHVDLPQKA
jgi:hypothetical protein